MNSYHVWVLEESMKKKEGCVDIENGLVILRFTSGK